MPVPVMTIVKNLRTKIQAIIKMKDPMAFLAFIDYLNCIQVDSQQNFLEALLKLAKSGDKLNLVIAQYICMNGGSLLKPLIPAFQEIFLPLKEETMHHYEVLKMLLIIGDKELDEYILSYLDRYRGRSGTDDMLSYLFTINEAEYIRRSSEFFSSLIQSGISKKELQKVLERFNSNACLLQNDQVFIRMTGFIKAPGEYQEIINKVLFADPEENGNVIINGHSSGRHNSAIIHS